MATKYLQLEFSSGKFYEYSKTPQEGFETHIGKNNTTYRKYHKKGVSGELQSVNLYTEGKFGSQINVRLKDNDNIYVLSIQLFDQKRQVDSYAQSLIAFLPNLRKGQDVSISAYNFKPEDSKYSKIGVSIKSEGVKVERGVDFNHIPKLVFEPVRGGKKDAKAPTAASLEARNNFYIDILDEALKRLQYVKEEGQTKTEATPAPKQEAPKKTAAKKPVEAQLPDDLSDLPF